MILVDAFVHFFALVMPALVVSALSSGVAKMLWRTELRAIAWSRLFGVSAFAQALVLLAGLVVFGRDGKMLTYGLMVVAGATALTWAGFFSPRR